MGSMPVVMLDIGGQDTLQVSGSGDEEVVEAFPANGADPSLRVRIPVRGLIGRPYDVGADGGPDVIEGPGELGVPVADQVTNDSTLVFQSGG